jgi:hypothetical protein
MELQLPDFRMVLAPLEEVRCFVVVEVSAIERVELFCPLDSSVPFYLPQAKPIEASPLSKQSLQVA